MSKIDKAIEWALNIANDSSHGYDQASRWGPNYDCSSLLISAWEAAGVPVKSKGASYTGNMKSVFLKCGFKDVTKNDNVEFGMGAGLQRGDILLHEGNHTAMYLGGGQIVQASINERGGITGGQSGDQTGGEIHVRYYYNYPWQVLLRYVGEDAGEVTEETTSEAVGGASGMCTVTLPLLKNGSEGASVKALQTLLILRGYKLPKYGADGDFGSETVAAVKQFQKAAKLTVDGVVGAKTWKALVG